MIQSTRRDPVLVFVAFSRAHEVAWSPVDINGPFFLLQRLTGEGVELIECPWKEHSWYAESQLLHHEHPRSSIAACFKDNVLLECFDGSIIATPPAWRNETLYFSPGGVALLVVRAADRNKGTGT